MAWTQISGFVPQVTASGEQANGYVLKFYEPTTTTPLLMATDSTGGTTTTDFLLNAQGFTTLTSNIVIPHTQQSYKEVLYLNQVDADANDTGSAVYIIDNLTIAGLSAGIITSTELATDSVTTIKIVDAAVTLAKLLTLDDTKIIIGGTTANAQYAVSGDGTLSNTGVFAIGNGKVTEAMLTAALAAKVTGGVVVGAMANKSSNQSITINTETQVTFDTEDYDTDSIHASSAFTIPSGYTYAKITATVYCTYQASPIHRIRLKKGTSFNFVGNAGVRQKHELSTGSWSSNYYSVQLTTPWLPVSSGNTFTLWFTSNQNPTAIEGGTSYDTTYWAIELSN